MLLLLCFTKVSLKSWTFRCNCLSGCRPVQLTYIRSHKTQIIKSTLSSKLEEVRSIVVMLISILRILSDRDVRVCNRCYYRSCLAMCSFTQRFVLSSKPMCARQTSIQMNIRSVARNATLGRGDG